MSSAAKGVPTSITGYSARRIRSDPDVPASSSSEPPGRHRHLRNPIASGVHCSVLRKRHPRRCRTSVGKNGRVRPQSSSAPAPARTAAPRLASGLGAALENCIASTSVLKCNYSLPFVSRERAEECAKFQATKSQRWMPWRQMPMKVVGGCDKPRGAVYQALIRGSPNGETRLGSCPVTPA